jgi:hypothetical protein
MNTLEDRLRDALTERAALSRVGLDAWDKTVARSRRRRPAWARPAWMRPGLVAPVASAAAIVAIAVAVTSVASRPSGGSPSPSSPASSGPDRHRCLADGLSGCYQHISETVTVKHGSGARAMVATYFFGYSKLQATPVVDFCAEAKPEDPAGVGTGGGGQCAPASLSGALAFMWDVQPWSIRLNLRQGLVVPQATSVTAVLTDGRAIPGTVVSGRGFPDKAWQVVYPHQDPATLLFRDPAGHLVTKLFAGAADLVLPASGPGITLFSTPSAGTMTVIDAHGLLLFSSASRDDFLGGYPAAGWPAVTALVGSGSGFGGNECFGYLHAGVTRLVIRLDNGYQVSVSAFKAAWAGSGIRLFAVALPRSYFSWKDNIGSGPQGTVTAYAKDGHVLATEPLIGTVQR